MADTRYTICQKTIIMNAEYAKKKNNNIVIILFNDGVIIYTNIKISDEGKEFIKIKYKKFIQLNDELSYDDIITKINESYPHNGTDFSAPFEFLECVPEIMSTLPEIIFLSDGENMTKITSKELELFNKYKSQVTTMGIGNKSNFDHKILSLISKTNDTVEGESADIIQNELLARMADSQNSFSCDIWRNVTITIMTEKNNLKIGSLVQVEKITKDVYDEFTPINSIENTNLIIDRFDNTLVIKKKDEPIKEIDMKKNTIIFIVDQSGSMQYSANVNSSVYNHSETLSVNNEEENDIIERDDVYVKYTIKYSVMKSYQLFLMQFIDPTKMKAQITYTDYNNVNQSLIISDMSKWSNIELTPEQPKIEMVINIINEIGHCINISNIENHSNKIGYFRKIYSICNKNKKFIADITEAPLYNVCLMEQLHYNIKQGKQLYYTTLSRSERNMDKLLRAASDGSSRQMSAAVTMSAVCGRSPSQPTGHNEESSGNNIGPDISMCIICYDEIREYVFSCGHCYSCKECAEKLLISEPMNKCSYCKQDVTSIRKISMNDDQKNPEHYYKCIIPDCFNIAITIASCPPVNENDSGYHLTQCDKCYKMSIKNYKKKKQTHICFCGNEIKEFKKVIFP